MVLRYGHRVVRDYRVTTHCCLVARAFGAKKIIVEGPEDKNIIESVKKINAKWGGNFEVRFEDSWRRALREHKKKGFIAVHATMYGALLPEKINRLKKEKKVLVIIGSQKVEKNVYELSDYNISVTTQPHSEIAALAVLLDWLQAGKELAKGFEGAKVEIVPANKGKKIKIKQK